MKKLTTVATRKNKTWIVWVLAVSGCWYKAFHTNFRVAARIAERRACFEIVGYDGN